MTKLLLFLLAPDDGGTGGSEGGDTRAAPPAPPAEPPAEGEEDDEFKGWWGSQLSKETKEKHKDKLSAMKGKALGDVLDDYFSTKNSMDRAIMLPQKDAGPEEIKAFLSKMGVPEKPEGYGLKAEILGDTDGAKKYVGELSAQLHKMGLTTKQGQQVFAEIATLEKMGMARIASARQAIKDSFETRLKEHFGGDETKSKETTEYFKRFITSLKDVPLAREMEATGILYSPRFAAAMAAYHKAYNQEAPNPKGGKPGTSAEKKGMPMSKEWADTYGG